MTGGAIASRAGRLADSPSPDEVPCRRRLIHGPRYCLAQRASSRRAASQTALAKFAIPNTTSLLSVYEGQAQANQSTGEAAKNTWFVPNTPNWANVESANVLQNMLESIATKKSSIAAATKTADGQLNKILNGSN